MWALIKSLFGGESTAGKALDIASKSIGGVGEWIDNKDYTNQEKAKDLSKAVEAHLELIKATQNENSMRSVTRRWLAWGVTGYMLLWATVAMVFAIFGKDQIVQRMIDVVEAFHLGWVFLAVMGFYFGVQLLRK